MAWIRSLPPRRRDALTALATFVCGTGLYLLDVRAIVNAPVPLWVRIAVLAFACAGQLFRSTTPLLAIAICTAGVATDFALGATFSMLLVLADLCFVAVLYTSQRVSRIAFVIICLVAVGVAFAVSRQQTDGRQILLSAVQIFGLFVVPLWWATSVRGQTEIAESERARAEQLRRIGELDRQAAVDAERSTMARDLHDVIAGHLSAIAIQSEAALSMMDNRETVHSALTAIRGEGVTALEEMRSMIGLLRSGSATGALPHGAPPRLTDIEPLLSSARAAGTPLSAEVLLPAHPLPAATDLAGYRIVQEALTNTVQHAPQQPVTVTLSCTGTALTITVRNELAPDTPTQRSSGMGVTNMAERAHDVGGTASIGREGEHWLVSAELPLGPPR